MKDAILKAMRADAVPAGIAGLWSVTKAVYEKIMFGQRGGQFVWIPQGCYTYLYRFTSNKEEIDTEPEVVMHDTPDELRTHLNFTLRAYGRVLVTGLGLGCVARGLLANPRVTEVVVIENSIDVLKLVGRYMPVDPRLKVVLADAREWVKTVEPDRFDCAWNDLWTDTKNGEPHLDLWHAQILVDLNQKVKMVGAWALARHFKRRMKQKMTAQVV